MAANQYGYPPPPPPPQQHAGPPAGYPQYQQHQYGGHQSSRGGGRGRGRGNHNQGGRGDFHASSQYNHHAGGFNGPTSVGGGYVQQNPAPYIGPQPPNQISPNGYPGPQWHEQQHHQPPHHQQQQQLHQPPAPIPLSAHNYHPNYAPQVYNQPQPQQQQQPPQYGPHQPFHHSPPQNSYAQHVPPSQPTHHPSGPPQPQQQWQGPPHQGQPPYAGGGRGRGRGNPPSRGGFEAPLMGPPIRMGFGDDRSVDPMPQASNGYPPPYANPQHSQVPFSQPAYQGYPQNLTPRGRPPLDPNPFYSQGTHRGRGGFQHRGKRDPISGDKLRHRNNIHKNRHSNGSSFQSSVTDLPQKPAAEDGSKLGESKKKKKKKRKTNTLGLTPHTEEYEESEEEDDIDEESRLAAAIGGIDGPKGPSDVAIWLAERRQRWPTKARREAREAELAKRRAQAAEQSARDKSKAKKEREDREAMGAVEVKKEDGAVESKLERQQRKAEKLRKKLERTEKKLQDAMQAGTKRKRDERDDGDEEGEVSPSNGAGGGDLVDQVIAKATAGANAVDNHSDSSSSGSSGDTTDSDSDSDSDSEPETHTSRQTGPVQVLPPKKPILQRQCKYFSTGGTCGKKGKCRFVHDQSVRDAALREKEMNGGRMTLAQRLVQNDKEKEDVVIVKSIKFLGDRGLLNEPHATSASYSYHMDMNENMQKQACHESYVNMEPFDNTSQPDIHENMMYGED